MLVPITFSIYLLLMAPFPIPTLLLLLLVITSLAINSIREDFQIETELSSLIHFVFPVKSYIVYTLFFLISICMRLYSNYQLN